MFPDPTDDSAACLNGNYKHGKVLPAWRMVLRAVGTCPRGSSLLVFHVAGRSRDHKFQDVHFMFLRNSIMEDFLLLWICYFSGFPDFSRVF